MGGHARAPWPAPRSALAVPAARLWVWVLHRVSLPLSCGSPCWSVWAPCLVPSCCQEGTDLWGQPIPERKSYLGSAWPFPGEALGTGCGGGARARPSGAALESFTLASEDRALQGQRHCPGSSHVPTSGPQRRLPPGSSLSSSTGPVWRGISQNLVLPVRNQGPEGSGDLCRPRAMSEALVVPSDLVLTCHARGGAQREPVSARKGLSASRRQAGPGKRRLPLGQLRLPGSVFSVLNMDKETVIFRKQMVMIRA